MHHPTDRIAHTTAFVTPVMEHWLEREIAQWVHHMKDRSDDLSHHERTLLPRSHISLPPKASAGHLVYLSSDPIQYGSEMSLRSRASAHGVMRRRIDPSWWIL